jgi:hypothetical protein
MAYCERRRGTLTIAGGDRSPGGALFSVTFAANMGTGADLNASAVNALAAAFALGGSGVAQVTAAQFTFGGRTYLAIEQTAAGTAAFDDTTDLLIDITGSIGTIGNGNFL